jgi:hypothetical protein
MYKEIKVNKPQTVEIEKVIFDYGNNYGNNEGLTGLFKPKFGTGNPCEHCPNNPKNNPFSSGFCNCALPSLMNPMY